MHDDFEPKSQEQQKFLGERITYKITFLRKVYFLFLFQFAILSTVLYLSNGILADAFKWISIHRKVAIATVSTQIFLLFLISYARSHFRNSPINGLVYVLWIALLTYNIAFLSTTQNIVPEATMISITIFLVSLGLLVYALTSKYDLSYVGGAIFLLTSTLFIYESFLIASDLSVYTMLVVNAGCFVFGFYFIFVTHSLIARHTPEGGYEDSALASIFIYAEVLLLPLRLIQLIGGKNY
jgi:FtsH-binding integral membrane protein